MNGQNKDDKPWLNQLPITRSRCLLKILPLSRNRSFSHGSQSTISMFFPALGRRMFSQRFTRRAKTGKNTYFRITNRDWTFWKLRFCYKIIVCPKGKKFQSAGLKDVVEPKMQKSVTYHGNILPNYELTQNPKTSSFAFCASFWAGCVAGAACPGAAWASSGAAIGWGNWSSTGPSAMSTKIRVGIGLNDPFFFPSSCIYSPAICTIVHVPACIQSSEVFYFSCFTFAYHYECYE